MGQLDNEFNGLDKRTINNDVLEPVWTNFFSHSILITHHLKYHVCLALSLTFHHSIFFTLFVGPIPVTGAAFSFSFFQYPNSLNPVKKKKKKKDQTSEKKKEEKKRKKELHS